MKCVGLWAQAPACPCVWGRLSSPWLLYYSCLLVFSFIATALSVLCSSAVQQLSCNNHGSGDSVEFNISNGGCIFNCNWLPISPSGCHSDCSCWRLGLINSLTGCSLCLCWCHRSTYGHWKNLQCSKIL